MTAHAEFWLRFLPADALWTFAMACNVYLSFFRQYDPSQLRGLEWRYLIACYGIPFVPAFIFLFIDSGDRGKVYGDAVVCKPPIDVYSIFLTMMQLWCWVTTKWNVLRIASYYGPVWLVILTTVFIYVRVGMVVFAWRKQLISQSRSETRASNIYPMKNFPASPMSPMSPTEPHQQRFQSIHETGFPETNTNVDVEKPQIRTLDANKATLSYCKTAMLFFIALLCTWYATCTTLPSRTRRADTRPRVPSTVNRVYTLVRPNDSLFGLYFASGMVLPLQGFWNTLIYIATSLPACKALWAEIVAACSSRATRPDRTTSALTLAAAAKLNHRVSALTTREPTST